MDIGPILRLARRQAGVVSVRQCIAMGTPPTTLARAAAHHHLGRPHRGVLTLPGADLEDARTRTWIALCAVGAPAWIGGLASLAARDVVRTPATVDVIVPSERKPTAPHGARLRRLRLGPDDVARIGRLPVLRVARALAEVAALERYDEALGAAASAVQRRATTIPGLRDVADRVRTGARALRRVADDLEGSRAQSLLAHRTTELLRSHGFRLVAEAPVVRADGSVAHLDLAVVGSPVAIEVDGHGVHSDREALSRDRTRQNQLLLTGRTVLRVDWLRLATDPDGFVAEVRAAVDATTRDRR